MAAKSIIKDHEPKQLELVKLPKNQINQQIADEVADVMILKSRRQKALGEAKKLLNEMKEKMSNIESLAPQTCNPRIKEGLEAILAELAEEIEDEAEGECANWGDSPDASTKAKHAEDWVDEE